MRFLPDIRYGTENYPEKVARRLRALNLTTWCGAAIAVFGCATVRDPRIPRSEAGVVEGWHGPRARRVDLGPWIPVASPLPGALWSALIGTSTVQAYFFSLTWLFGTGSGGQMSFLMAAALNFILIGTERILLSAVLGCSGCAASCRTGDHGSIRYRAVRRDDAVCGFRWHGHCERGLPDWDGYFCPPRN